MNKRIFDITSVDIANMSRSDVVESIRRSEGRTLMVENVVTFNPPYDVVSGAEIAAAFGADLITLNGFDVCYPGVVVTDEGTKAVRIETIKKYTGRLLGCNLEPVDQDIYDIPYGRTVSYQNVERAIELGLDYIMITGNPGYGVTQEAILEAIKVVRDVSADILIIAGKMHGGGAGNDYNLGIVQKFADAGADIVMFPAPYTTPGVTPELATEMMKAAHQAGLLGLLAMGTSQETACESYIETVAMASKAAGADIVHIGDAGAGGIACPENIMRMGITIRGRRHQYKRMANRR